MSIKLVEKYKAMQKDLTDRVNEGRLNNMTLNEYFVICYLGKELLKHHAVKTIIKNVADYFKAFRFMVTMDFDNVNYVIAEV